MSKEDLNQEEEVEETKPSTESESDDATELDALFADDSDDEDDEDENDKVAKLEKKIENIEKGVRKFFSEQGRKAKQEKKVENNEEVKPVPTDDISELFFAQIPQAELVQEDLKTIADAKYGGSILKAWKGEKWLQEKSKALAAAKKEDEANREKIKKPASGTAPHKTDISSVKPEDVEKLKPSEKIEWLKLQVEKERNSDD